MVGNHSSRGPGKVAGAGSGFEGGRDEDREGRLHPQQTLPGALSAPCTALSSARAP